MTMNRDFAKFGAVLFALALTVGMGASQTSDTTSVNITQPSSDAVLTLGTDDSFDISADLQFNENLTDTQYMMTLSEQIPSGASENVTSYTVADTSVEDDQVEVNQSVLRSTLEDENLSFMEYPLSLSVDAVGTNESSNTTNEVYASDSVQFDVEKPVIDIVKPEEGSTVEIAENGVSTVEVRLDPPADAQTVTVELAENEEMNENTSTVTLVNETQISELETQNLVEADFTLSDVSDFESNTTVINVEMNGENMTSTQSEMHSFTVVEDESVLDQIGGIIGDGNVDDGQKRVAVIAVLFAVLVGLAVVGYRKLA